MAPRSPVLSPLHAGLVLDEERRGSHLEDVSLLEEDFTAWKKTSQPDFRNRAFQQFIDVSQIPVLTATVGSTVTLQCNYTSKGRQLAMGSWFRWYKHLLNGPEVSNSNPEYMSRISRISQEDFINKQSADIQLHRVGPTDSGIYICQVGLKQDDKGSGHGNGTFLKVTGSLSQIIHVSQIPAVQSISGGTVTLPCSFTLSDTEVPVIGWFTWYRHALNGPEVTDNNPDFIDRVSRASQIDFITNRSANIVLHRVDPKDTGMYICQIVLQNEMITGHGEGTLLTVTGSLSQAVYVSQIPVVTMTAGSSVTLQCNYTLSSDNMTGTGWFKWYRHTLNGPEVSNNNPDYKGRVSRVGQSDFVNKGSANIVLHRVEPKDTGKYICHVMLQDENEASGHGTGTFLNVTDIPEIIENQYATKVENVIRIILGVLIIVSIAPIILCCDKKGSQCPAQEQCKKHNV
ncbi:uncharacterized protein LOC128666496 [Bombina bombina]|uniref:uncharacterized protein LOC128666496 n=1 Tax=Bombina bombina TaxID=8345 RepID=UPI00235ABDA7|nr:uncharacterized protein LOC128666496 [Bombina bombina]